MEKHVKYILPRKRWVSVVVNSARIIVGVLFIFSGLIKANDPLGLSYKMDEFFDAWHWNSIVLPALSFKTFIPYGIKSLIAWSAEHSLFISVSMITLEIVVGIAILLGWATRFFSWLLVLLIGFFTFLTAYAVFSGKIATCGCFGDCIPLTAMQSFTKDIILCVLILIIFFGNRYIYPLFRGGLNFIFIVLTVALAISFQWYVQRHLPLKDCLPFKVGNNILELRKMPADATQDKFDYTFIYEKNGEKKEFKSDALPDSTWKYVDRKQVLLEKGKNNVAPIKDFFLNTLDGVDTTEGILNQTGDYYLLFVQDPNKAPERWLENFKKVIHFAMQSGRRVIVVASQPSVSEKFFNADNGLNIPIVSLDATALKTAGRTDPTLYLMHGPVVMKKWGWADLGKADK